MESVGPVSYTHLDVYKRQYLESRDWVQHGHKTPPGDPYKSGF